MQDVEVGVSLFRRRRRFLFFLSFVLIVVFSVSVSLGSSGYGLSDMFVDESARAVLLHLRLPRAVCAVVVGFGLALIGGMYQSLFKNNLASPFTLGVSSGGALAASVALTCGFVSGRDGAILGIWALIGAALSVCCILIIHKFQHKREPHTLLLVGVVFSFFCSSLMALVQYIADYSELFQVTRWLMGGMSSSTWEVLFIGFIAVALTFTWAMRHARVLDLLLFGDDLATVKGVDVFKETRILFILSSVVVGWIVAQCGVVGFVGIVVPAVARMLVGISHRVMLPVAGVLGAILVSVCDTAGRVVIAPFEIPAGVFTAVLGGPVFIWLLLRRDR